MFEEIKKVTESIYGFKIDGGRILLPQESHPLPEEVKRRADYFSEEFDSGMTFNGVMMCIFSENAPDFFDVVAGSDWLPKSEDFETWEDKSGRLSQFAVATYLIYGDGTKCCEDCQNYYKVTKKNAESEKCDECLKGEAKEVADDTEV